MTTDRCSAPSPKHSPDHNATDGSTNVGPPWVDGRDGRFDHEYIDRIFSGSLERLGVDTVEVLYTHAPDDHPERPPGYEPVGIEVTLDALESIRASGRVGSSAPATSTPFNFGKRSMQPTA